jgi:Tol biopolymer transport system component
VDRTFNYLKYFGNSLAWAPDNQKLMFATGADESNELILVDTNTYAWEKLAVLSQGSWVSDIQWSPVNDSLVAYTLCRAPGTSVRCDIYLADIEKKEITRVSNGGNARQLRWAPDGSEISYYDLGITLYNLTTKTMDNRIVPRDYTIRNIINGLDLPTGHSFSIYDYFPQFNAFQLQIMVRDQDDQTVSYNYLLSREGDQAELLYQHVGTRGGTYFNISPDGKWINTIQSHPFQNLLLYMPDKNLEDISNEVLWILDWSPDNKCFVAVTYREDFDWHDYSSQDEIERMRLGNVLQISIINAFTLEKLTTYTFPESIEPLLKKYNWYLVGEYGIGIGWPDR